MRLDRDICLGGRFNNKDIISIKYNGYYIFEYLFLTCASNSNNITSDVRFYDRNADGEIEILNKIYYELKESVGDDGLTISKFSFRPRGEKPLKIMIGTEGYPNESIKRIDSIGGFFDYEYAFHYMWYLEYINLSHVNTRMTTNMSGLFNECLSLKEIDVSSFDTSNVTNMYRMFYSCQSLTQIIGLNSFDTSNVTNMSQMFSCYGETRIPIEGGPQTYVSYHNKLEEIDVSSFNTSNVTNMSSMFNECVLLKELDLSNFDTSKVTNMKSMFSGCESLTSLDVSSFNTDSVTNMQLMFAGCETLTELDLSNFYTGNVGYVSRMFYDCSALTTLDLSNFDISKATDIDDMFRGCYSLQTLILKKCSYDTIYKIITSLYFPTGTVNGTKRKIYCKQTNAAGLEELLPEGWNFEFVPEDAQ